MKERDPDQFIAQERWEYVCGDCLRHSGFMFKSKFDAEIGRDEHREAARHGK